MSVDDDIWYAVNQTRVMTEPQHTLETFGVTRIRYYIVSEVMDSSNQVKVHEGVVISEKPGIITPAHFAQQVLEGFGEHAREYTDWLTQHGELIKVLQYGLQIRKEEIKEETVHGSLAEVLGRVIDMASQTNELSTVIQGVEDMWEVSLMKFMQAFVAKSAGKNFQDLHNRQHMLEDRSRENMIREIENEFYDARGQKSKITELGAKLRDLGLFAKYEDRFYALLRECS